MSRLRYGFLPGRFCALIAHVFHQLRQPDPVDFMLNRLRELFPEIGAAAPSINDVSELASLQRDRPALAASIFSQDLAIAVASTAPETMEFITRAVDRDFADGRCIMIEGWTLSQTEVRLLALVAADGT